MRTRLDRRRGRRVLTGALAAIFGCAGLLALGPPAAVAASIGHPAFVTETDAAVWDDCTFAAGAMLLERWTSGAVALTHAGLRAASGAPQTGASSLDDLRAGIHSLTGIDPAFSPYGRDPLSWGTLLSRLERGGGAVLLGSYANLPALYTRWDPAFAAEGPAASGHAIYIDTYDPATNRLWLMDPLGRGSYAGEWIGLADLQAFAWTDPSGNLYAMATPAPARSQPVIDFGPYHGIRLGSPALLGTAAGSEAQLVIAAPTNAGPTLQFTPGLRALVTFTQAGQPTVAPSRAGTTSVAPTPATSPAGRPRSRAPIPRLPADDQAAATMVLPPPAPQPGGVPVSSGMSELSVLVTLPAPGTYTVRVTLLDASGAPLDRAILPVVTPSSVTIVRGPTPRPFGAHFE